MPVPYQKYSIDPRDLSPNVAVGVALPFNSGNVFTSTYSTREQIKYNLINLLLTNKGERVQNPEFGTNVRRYIFEFITQDNVDALKASITNSIATYIPEIIIDTIDQNLSEDTSTVALSISYTLKLSGTKDNVTINFE